MELVKAALAEALRVLRLQAPPASLQDAGPAAPTRARYACGHPLFLLPGSGHGLIPCLLSSPAAPPALPPPRSPSLVSRGTQTETEVGMEASRGTPGLSNGPPAPQGASEEPSGTQSEGGGSSSSGTGSPGGAGSPGGTGSPGILRLVQPPQCTDT